LFDVATADPEMTGRLTGAGPEGTLFIMPGIGISAGQGSS
jgi:hypothetical protein